MTTYAAETKTSVMTKKDFQEMRKALIKHGLPIKKTECGNGYKLVLPNGLYLLKAMNGSNGYLVKYVKDLFA